MRRWIIVFLMVVLPNQFLWAAAAQYCGHESSNAQVSQAAATNHYGHHEHQHQAALADSQDSGGFAHTDCVSCHLAHCTSVPTVFGVHASAVQAQEVVYREPHYLSGTPSGPERPQRPASPFAVRFGSGHATAPFIS